MMHHFSFFCIVFLIALAGCSGNNIERESQTLKTPDNVNYTKNEQNEVADELMNCLDCSMIERFLIDYKVMRDQARALKTSYK